MAMVLKDVSFGYGDTAVLSGLSVTFPKRGIVCLTGPSGCGKTTLLRLLSGLILPDRGEISGLPARPSVLFQEDRLLPWETALDNLRLVLPDETAAREWLLAVGLVDAAKKRPRAMSGGMRRRLALCRALAFDGDALLLDEPFTGIDPERTAEMAVLLREYAKTRPIVVVTHSAEDAALLKAKTWRLIGSPVTACQPVSGISGENLKIDS